MELKNQLTEFVSKYKNFRIPVLVLMIGLVFMLFPNKGKNEMKQIEAEPAEEKVIMDQQIEDILEKIEGVGEVSVLLSIGEGEKRIFQTDTDVNVNSDSKTDRETTVILDTTNNDEVPIVSQVVPPRYTGAIIACQGADSASVRFAVVEAVSKITGLGADRICVLKMK